MELNAAVIIEACRAGAEEAARLAPFLDDLDGWDGADCDTGTNAAATMAALEAAMESWTRALTCATRSKRPWRRLFAADSGTAVWPLVLSSRHGPERWGTSSTSRRSRCAACSPHP